MFKIITKEPLVGQELKLTESNVENWDDLVQVADNTDEIYNVEIVHNNKILLGKLIRFKDTSGEIAFAVAMDVSVILPSGVCIKLDGIDIVVPSTECFPDKEIKLTKSTRLAVMDGNGCIMGYAKISDILDLVEPPSLCDILPPAEERNGDLVAQDRILTISGKCNIKAVKQSELKCK